MSSANLGWLFYKDYFDGVDYLNLENRENEHIIQDKVLKILDQKPTLVESEILGSTRFKAKTTYPGLLLGSGNAHELPSIDAQAILGFHFDYTTGLPVIQGSSVKGVLRSAFEHWEYIAEYTDLKTEKEVKALEDNIFINGDIFYDATIIEADKYGKILGDDYLAPHGEDPLKSPKVLRFIKVLPEVTFRFEFDLSDEIITKEKKSRLFQNILEDLGLGAKTNVGYGKFENFCEDETEEEKLQKAKDRELQLALTSDNLDIKRNFLKNNPDSLKAGHLAKEIEELEQIQQNSKWEKVNTTAQKAWEGIHNPKYKASLKKSLANFVKKWEAKKNNKGSEFILGLVEKAKQEL